MAEQTELAPDAPEQPAEGKKKIKAPKIKKAPPPQQTEETAPDTRLKPEKKAKAAKAAPKKGGFPLILLPLALLSVLLLVAGLVFYFDLFAARSLALEAANNALASLDADYRHYSENLLAWESTLNAREQELAQKEEALAKDTARLEKRIDALDARERRLNERQLNSTPLFRREISEEKLAELKYLGKIYSGMDAETAAQALSLLNKPMEMAEVLFYMENSAAAGLLSALEPSLAAQITSEMLRE